MAVPTANMTDWIAWLPVSTVQALLNDCPAANSSTTRSTVAEVADRVFPKFRVPKQDEDSKGDAGA